MAPIWYPNLLSYKYSTAFQICNKQKFVLKRRKKREKNALETVRLFYSSIHCENRKTEAKRKGSLFVTSAWENLILSFNWTSTRLLKMLEKFCLETMFCSFVHSEMFFIRRTTKAVKTFSLGIKSKLCNFYMYVFFDISKDIFYSTVDSQFLKFIRVTTASAFFASFWHFVTSKEQMICNSSIIIKSMFWANHSIRKVRS